VASINDYNFLSFLFTVSTPATTAVNYKKNLSQDESWVSRCHSIT